MLIQLEYKQKLTRKRHYQFLTSVSLNGETFKIAIHKDLNLDHSGIYKTFDLLIYSELFKLLVYLLGSIAGNVLGISNQILLLIFNNSCRLNWIKGWMFEIF